MRGRALVWWGVGLVVVAALVVLIVSLQGGGTDDVPPDPYASSAPPEATPTPTPDPVDAPVPPPTAAPDEVQPDADAFDLALPFVAADALLRSDPEQPVTLDAIATGPALADLEAGALELATEGLRQIGAPEVVSAVVTASDPSAAPPTATVLACLDFSEVDVVTSSGESVVDPAAPNRVATIYELVQVDGAWLVERRTFPDDPTC